LIVSGVVVGALYAAVSARRRGDNSDHIWNALTMAIIFGVVGARLYHVFSSPKGGMVGWAHYRAHPAEILHIWEGGLGIYGALLGGVLGVLLYAWRAGIRPLRLLDYGAPGAALAQAVGRWGNFINQELYGPPTDLPWGLVIDPAYRIAPYDDLLRYPPETLFHPTFLYESIWCLFLFAVLAVTSHRFRDRLREGDLLLGYLMGYSVGRFFLEYLRPDAWMIGPMAAAQLVALLCVVAACAAIVIRRAVTPSVRPVGLGGVPQALGDESRTTGE
jgi:phosphatidylglycerol:prolipoprotein diacylglycerol transferase